MPDAEIDDPGTCCLCGESGSSCLLNAVDNFVKFKDLFVPFSEVMRKTINFQLPDDNLTISLCSNCKSHLVDFFLFKMRSQEFLDHNKPSTPHHQPDDHIKDKIVYSTVQIVRNFIQKHSITEIKETASELVITPKPKVVVPNSESFQEPISIKQEPVEVKLEPIDIEIKEDPDPDLPFLDFVRSFGESAAANPSCDTSSNEESSSSSLSRLPAFESAKYFDGDKFVLRTEKPPKKLKEPKKRQRKPEQWATNVQKRLRNSGQQYRSAKGFLVEARSMGAPCDCRQQCGTKVNEKNRLMNFSSYWRLEDTAKKRKFIFDHIRLERPMRAMTKSRALSRLILHYLDVVNSDGTLERVKVCKSMFLSTLDISNTIITTTVKLSNQYL